MFYKLCYMLESERPNRLRRRIATAQIICLAILVASISMANFTAGAQTANGSAKRTPLQAGQAFYDGKTLQFIATTSAGSTLDLEDRAIALEMGTFLHATINVIDLTEGGTIGGQDALAASVPNGLTIGTYSLNAEYYDLVTGSPGTNFNQEHEIFLGGFPNTASVITTLSSSPYTTFSSLFQGTSSSPLRVLANNGITAIDARLLFRALGINVNFISYTNGAALLTGLLRGDGPLAAASLGSLEQVIETGQARVLATTLVNSSTHKDPYYSFDHAAPTISQLLKKYPPKTAIEKRAAKFVTSTAEVLNLVFGAPKRIAPDKVAALDAAFKYAIKTPAVRQAEATAGQTGTYIAPQLIKSEYAKSLNYVKDIASVLGY